MDVDGGGIHTGNINLAHAGGQNREDILHGDTGGIVEDRLGRGAVDIAEGQSQGLVIGEEPILPGGEIQGDAVDVAGLEPGGRGDHALGTGCLIPPDDAVRDGLGFQLRLKVEGVVRGPADLRRIDIVDINVLHGAEGLIVEPEANAAIRHEDRLGIPVVDGDMGILGGVAEGESGIGAKIDGQPVGVIRLKNGIRGEHLIRPSVLPGDTVGGAAGAGIAAEPGTADVGAEGSLLTNDRDSHAGNGDLADQGVRQRGIADRGQNDQGERKGQESRRDLGNRVFHSIIHPFNP